MFSDEESFEDYPFGDGEDEGIIDPFEDESLEEGFFDYGEEPEEDLDFTIGPSDYERITWGEFQQTDFTKRYMDPFEKTLNEIESEIKNCGIKDREIRNAKEKLKELDNLLQYNVELLSLSVCFHVMYKSINKSNINNFLKTYAKNKEPIDIIRYIRLLNKIFN